MSLLDDIIAQKLLGGSGGGGGGGAEVTPASIVTATGQMTAVQKQTTRSNLGAASNTEAQIEESITLQDAGEDAVIATIESTANHSAVMLEGELSQTVELFGLSAPTRNDAAATKGYVDGNTVTVSETTPTITPAANTIYKCGELTSLTISNPPATGAYSIVFTSGATATTTTFPSTILGLEDFAAEANTIYEINVLDNRAVVGKWAVSA